MGKGAGIRFPPGPIIHFWPNGARKGLWGFGGLPVTWARPCQGRRKAPGGGLVEKPYLKTEQGKVSAPTGKTFGIDKFFFLKHGVFPSEQSIFPKDKAKFQELFPKALPEPGFRRARRRGVGFPRTPARRRTLEIGSKQTKKGPPSKPIRAWNAAPPRGLEEFQKF